MQTTRDPTSGKMEKEARYKRLPMKIEFNAALLPTHCVTP